MSFTPDTTFYLLRNVDIDVSYNHTFDFDTREEQLAFFQSKIFKTVNGGTYQRKNSNMCELPFNVEEIRQAKYMMWQNNNYSSKWYFAFITMVEYVNPNVSYIGYELDVMQTYMFDIEWKKSFIEREHSVRYNSDGTPTINMEPEGLEYGSNYEIIKRVNLVQIPDVSFLVLGLTSNTSGRDRWSKAVRGAPTQLSYYIVPMYLQNGTRDFHYNFYVNGHELTNVVYVLEFFRSSPTWVNSLVSATIMPFITTDTSFVWDVDSANQRISINNLSNVEFETFEGHPAYSLEMMHLSANASYETYELSDATSLYSDFPDYEESKLLMYPYSFTELTTERGDSMILRNEYFINQDLPITIGVRGTVGYRNKMAFLIKDYLKRGYSMELGIHDNSNQSIPIIDDYTASYLQSNKNSIEVARSNALAQEQAAQQIAQNNYDTGIANLNRSREATRNNLIGNITSGVTNAVLSAAVGNELGAAVQTISTIGGAFLGGANMGLSYESGVASATTSLSNAYISSTTSYQNTIASIDAKFSDTQMIPPSTRSMGGDYMFDLGYECDGVYLVKKTIQPYYAQKLTNYFKMYGYKVNKLKIPVTHTRQSWNYLKIAQPNITGNIVMTDLLKIRDIFIKGITFWHVDDVGNYNLPNNEI